MFEKFEFFMTKKMFIFAGSFQDAFSAVRNIVYGRQKTKGDGQDEGSPQGHEAKHTSDE